MKGWDLRMDDGGGAGAGAVCDATPAFNVRGLHDAGVTSLCWSNTPGEEHAFVSGRCVQYVCDV